MAFKPVEGDPRMASRFERHPLRLIQRLGLVGAGLTVGLGLALILILTGLIWAVAKILT